MAKPFQWDHMIFCSTLQYPFIAVLFQPYCKRPSHYSSAAAPDHVEGERTDRLRSITDSCCIFSMILIFQLIRIDIPSYKARVYVDSVPLTATKVLLFNVLPSFTPSMLLSRVNVAHSINCPPGILPEFGDVTSTMYSSTPSGPRRASSRVSSALWKAQVFVALYFCTKNLAAAV
jgi:hypothetical protein